jgi:hypothetical protein
MVEPSGPTINPPKIQIMKNFIAWSFLATFFTIYFIIVANI